MSFIPTFQAIRATEASQRAIRATEASSQRGKRILGHELAGLIERALN